MKSVPAAYDGTCPACNERIVANVDEVVFSEVAGGWVHLECEENE